MIIYLVCRNVPPDWNATRIELSDVIVCAVTTEEEAEATREELVRASWKQANAAAVARNARIDDAVALGLLTERETLMLLEKVGFKRELILPLSAFRDDYYVYPLEVGREP